MSNKYIKRAIVVQVEFASAPGTIATLEGAVPYQTGDALMSGVNGERWPINRVNFDRTYDAVPPIRQGEDGSYIKKPIPVTAIQIEKPTQVVLSGSAATISGKIGDWLVTSNDGSRWIVADEIFRQTYHPLD